MLCSAPGRAGDDLIEKSFSNSQVKLVYRTTWIPEDQRRTLPILNMEFSAASEKTLTFRELLDRPTVVTFFYTRCTNARKCCSAMSRMASLQKQLVQENLAKRVRLIAITYEPEYDTSTRLSSYAKSLGIIENGNMQIGRMQPSDQLRLANRWRVPVSYRLGSVNVHGVYLLVLDERGRIARKYHTVVWDNRNVLNDLQRLVSESE